METMAQASIRRLFDQVRVLEAEAARRPPRRMRRDRAIVILAAAVLGAAGAGAHRAVTHHTLVHVRALPAVAHLIDAPSERARALPVHVRRRHVPRKSLQSGSAAPNQIAVASPQPVVSAPRPTEPDSAKPNQIPAVRTAQPLPRPKPHAAPAPAHAPAPAPAPVAVGSVVVVTADEPVPAPAP